MDVIWRNLKVIVNLMSEALSQRLPADIHLPDLGVTCIHHQRSFIFAIQFFWGAVSSSQHFSDLRAAEKIGSRFAALFGFEQQPPRSIRRTLCAIIFLRRRWSVQLRAAPFPGALRLPAPATRCARCNGRDGARKRIFPSIRR